MRSMERCEHELLLYLPVKSSLMRSHCEVKRSKSESGLGSSGLHIVQARAAKQFCGDEETVVKLAND
jgi:hypothetical protein